MAHHWSGVVGGTLVPPRFQADRLIRLPPSLPQRLGSLAPLPPLPCTPALACLPCESVVGCRQHLHSTPQPFWLWHTSASFIVLMAWVLFKHTASSALSSSSLWQESTVALVASNCSRVTFILSCSWMSSLVSLAGLTLGGVWCLEIKEMPSMSSVCGRIGWSSWGMVGARLGVSPHVATCGHLCEGCHWGRDDWVCLLLPKGIFCSFCWVWDPQGHWWWLFPRHTMLGDRGGMLWRKIAAATPGPPGDASLWPWWCPGEFQ